MVFWSYLRGENQPAGVLVEVVESRLRFLLHPVISRIRVDEEYYLHCNPDVSEKVRAGEISSAKEHYVSSGFYEDRFPRPFPVDETWYLSQYSDVREAVSKGMFPSARHHFERDGFKEGRLPSEGWSLAEDGAW